MKQFLTSYGPFLLMMLICLGSHLFMHRHGKCDKHIEKDAGKNEKEQIRQ